MSTTSTGDRSTRSDGDYTVSIILPVYNDSDTIERSLKSLLEQSYQNLEIIVVNDGSTDDTASRAREITKYDSRAKVVDIPHSGTSAAKNSGFSLSKGPVVLFAEGDALYEKDYVASAVRCLKEDPEIGGVCVLGGIWEVRRTFVTRSIEAENKVIHSLIHRGVLKPYYAWVFTRAALTRVGLYDVTLKQAEDRDLFNRVRSAGFRIGLVEGVHWRHRRFETTPQFFAKTVRKGERRIEFIVKDGRTSDFAKGVGLLWSLIVLVSLSLVVPEFAWTVLGWVVFFVAIFYWRLARRAQGANLSEAQFLELPIYQMLRYLANAIGYTLGILKYPFRNRSD
ncbi:MAG TPA: glycosyltransferase [Nitrososphaerales archaeon]|nr:glycosyltransferase [Nitrososphaerales archaeon]